eukprot:11137918-Heterocapsa_arctica.AAC.1
MNLPSPVLFAMPFNWAGMRGPSSSPLPPPFRSFRSSASPLPPPLPSIFLFLAAAALFSAL